MGSSRDELLDLLHAGKQKYSSIFNYPTLTWADMGAIGWLVDGAAITNQVPLCRCSYGPYARAMVRICKEESFHQRQGFELLLALSRGTPRSSAMAQDAVDRWWWPSLMMFGPPDDAVTSHRAVDGAGGSSASATTSCGRVRRHVRRRRRRCSGSTLPDPELRWNESVATTTSAPPDWDELFRVIKGNGPCNRSGWSTARRAHEEGRWVREAAAAYAAKHPRRASPRRWQRERRSKRPMAAVGGVRPARRGLSHIHVGSLHAPDAVMALRNARDVYTRRQEGVSHLGRAFGQVVASSPDEKDAFFDPAGDKLYRHPTFYDIPEGVKNL